MYAEVMLSSLAISIMPKKARIILILIEVLLKNYFVVQKLIYL